jgi:hypothetical protein
MKSIVAIILIVAPTFFAGLANAQVPVRERCTTIVNSLLDQGINKVGELDLNQLKEETKNLTWKESLKPPPEKVNGQYISAYRSSAYYSVPDKTITVTKSHSKETSTSRDLLELHECLGALGYREDSGNLSSAIDLINRAVDPGIQKRLVELFGKKIFSKDNLKESKSGGGTSVGGGGDINGLMMKRFVLDKILSMTPSVSGEFLINFVQIAFEPDNKNKFTPRYPIGFVYTILPDYKSAHYQLLGSLEDLRDQEGLSVVFSKTAWNSQTSREKMIGLIAKKILDFYPSQETEFLTTETLILEGCPLTEISYKKTTDSKMRLLHQQIEAFRNDCRNTGTYKRFYAGWPLYE